MQMLAFDCSIKGTGWAARWQLPDGKMNVASGVESFANTNKRDVPGLRFIRFNEWLDQMFKDYQPEVVVCEQPHHRGGRGTEALIGLCTRVEEYCARYGAGYVQLHSATLKKSATGSSRGSKEDMKDAAERTFKHYDRTMDTAEADEADALMMLSWGLENISL